MNTKKSTLILILIFCMTFSLDTYAKCSRDAKAKYQTQSGWSKPYSVEVSFMTGHELNQATGTFNYSAGSVYAIIFWDQGEASIIKLSNTLLCGFEVTCDCIDNTVTDLQGYDQDGDKWNICTSGYCF